jgi:hypothetical protein
MDWQLTEAKNRLSEVVNRALTEGPRVSSDAETAWWSCQKPNTTA